jgi:hypothetical protein
MSSEEWELNRKDVQKNGMSKKKWNKCELSKAASRKGNNSNGKSRSHEKERKQRGL